MCPNRSKSKAPTKGVRKKPFKRAIKKRSSLVNKPAVKQAISSVNKAALSTKGSENMVSEGGVKRSRRQETEKPTKRLKVWSTHQLSSTVSHMTSLSDQVAAPPPSQKDRRAFRKSQRPNSELSSKSKAVWEKLRRHDLPKEERVRLMDELMALFSGNFYQVWVGHSALWGMYTCLHDSQCV